MKNIFLILAISTSAFTAMGDDTNSVAISATNVAPIIGALEATNFYNQDVVITGRVAQVSVRPGITFINLDKRYPESPFAVVILGGRSKFYGDPSVLREHSIEVKGKVTNFHGRPEMLLNNNDQLTVDGVTNLQAFLQPPAASTNAPAN